MSIRSLSYVVWHSRDLSAWREFAALNLGLMVSQPEDDTLRIRWDDRSYRVMICEGSSIGIGALGFEVADDLELSETASLLEYSGYTVSREPPEMAASRGVIQMIKCEGPDGVPIEVSYGPVLEHLPLLTPLVSGFVTGEMGMGHAVITTADLSESSAFYRNVLGMQLRNTMNFQGPTGISPMHFFGCNSRHHSLAVLQHADPKRLLHIMIEVASIDDVGTALERCLDAGVKITQSIGRHTNDRMISFYCEAPDKTQIEFGCGGLRIDDPNQATVYEITKTSFWGHRPPKL